MSFCFLRIEAGQWGGKGLGKAAHAMALLAHVATGSKGGKAHTPTRVLLFHV